MTETKTTGAIEVRSVAQAIDVYKKAEDDLQREGFLNNEVVQRNPQGIAIPESFEAVMNLVKGEIDEKGETYMPDAVNELSGANLVALANAAFYKEGPTSFRTEGLLNLADRIKSIGARTPGNPVSTVSGDSFSRMSPEARNTGRKEEGLQYIFQRMAEKLAERNMDDDVRRTLIESLDRDMTPELMEHILRHEPELTRQMMYAVQEFSNPALVDVLESRSEAEEETLHP